RPTAARGAQREALRQHRGDARAIRALPQRTLQHLRRAPDKDVAVVHRPSVDVHDVDLAAVVPDTVAVDRAGVEGGAERDGKPGDSGAHAIQCSVMAHDDRRGHGHGHDHDHGSELSEMDVRVRAVESLLVEKGYVDPRAVDAIIQTYETKIGPRNGAHVVAK